MKMSSQSSQSPINLDVTDKSKKYDRQIRLWGDHGQTRLEAARICLVNANGLGCEILKGLILPGVGFTIADGSLVTEDDLGVNFFVEAEQVGKSKAAACAELLQELNPDVLYDSVEESLDYILANHPSFFDTFDVIVASNLNEKNLLQLSNCLWESNIPFIYCRSLGFYGSIRLQIREHCVIEAHPDNRQYDLRLIQPFPTLKKHFESATPTNKMPWPFIFRKFLEAWMHENGGRTPVTYSEKTQLRKMIEDAKPSEDAENYEQAAHAVNTAFLGGTVTSDLQRIFDDNNCSNLTKLTKPFWIIARALNEFVQNDNNGFLPLPGVLPDMTADTKSYIDLQKVYREQALNDANIVFQKCQKYLKDFGLSEDTISLQTVRLFCREAAGVAIFRGSKIADEHLKSNELLSSVDDLEVQGSHIETYLVLRAYERFISVYSSIPGEVRAENDIAPFKCVASKMLSDWGTQTLLSDDIIHEICRYGGSEIHSVSAFIGGCAAQEVIKIVTKQYRPIDNTFLYNAFTTQTRTLKL